jgi:hypothetical protein
VARNASTKSKYNKVHHPIRLKIIQYSFAELDEGEEDREEKWDVG